MSRSSKEGPTAAGYLFALGLANGPGLIALWLGMREARFLGWTVACATGWVLGVLWFRWCRARAVLIATPVAAMLAPMLVAGFGADSVTALRGPSATITLDELNRTPDLELVAIGDAEVRRDLVGTHRSGEASNRSLTRDHCAAPIVAAGWSRSDSVLAWLICDGDADECEAIWELGPVGVVRHERTAKKAVVENAVAKHALRTPEQIVTLTSSSSPRLDAWIGVLVGMAAMLFVNLLTLSLAYLISRRGRLSGGTP